MSVCCALLHFHKKEGMVKLFYLASHKVWREQSLMSMTRGINQEKRHGDDGAIED